MGENLIFTNCGWCYIVSMYKNYQLTLFLVLIGKFNQKSNLQPRWPELGHIKAEWA